jgi:putative transposon-encoded protein
MDKQDFKISGYQLIEKVARNGGDSARVFVPKTWKDKRVALILLEELE